MEPVWSALPELDRVGPDSVATPVVGPFDGLVGPALLGLDEGAFECGSVGHHDALV
jgi:hypothetical protein